MMHRFLSVGLVAAFVAASGSARAQSNITGEATGAVEHVDNVFATPEGIDPIADQIISVRPSLKALLERRGLTFSAGYTLAYYHYQKETDLARAFHTLDARGALIWWDNLDLELNGRMTPVPVSLIAPITDPTNQVQQGAGGGRIAYRRELGRLTSLSAGYRGEQVVWLETHDDNDGRLPAEYLTHGPELRLDRELTELLRAGLEYQYRMQEYDETSEAPFIPSNYVAHQALARLTLDRTR